MNWKQALAVVGIFVAFGLFRASPAAADYQGHGSCLVVSNHQQKPIEVKVNIPYEYAATTPWTVYPASSETGGWVLTTSSDQPIKSADGHWSVTTTPSGTYSWRYGADRNTSLGCNGSWVLTVR